LHDFGSEFFGPNHCHEQIDEQQQRDDADGDCFHFLLLQLLAKTHVQRAHDKKGDGDSDKN
jgi:hypothetical protein